MAIVPFAQAVTSKEQNVSEIVSADLRRSGLFKMLETGGMRDLPTDISQVKYPEWAALQAQAIAVGKVESLSGNRLKVSFQLVDVFKKTQLVTMEYSIAPAQLRMTAHKIADVIYQKLTGESGIFASRIAYISKTTGRYVLQVADVDGMNPKTVVYQKSLSFHLHGRQMAVKLLTCRLKRKSQLFMCKR